MPADQATWKQIVATALEELGGQAHLSEINRKIEGHPKTRKNPTWKDTIRRVVRQYSIFEPVPPARSGIYQLIKPDPIHLQRQAIDSQDAGVNHSTAQGMLVTLGNTYGYDTFVPTHDQSKANFQGRTLRDLVTIRDCNDIFRGPNLAKIREIDVLWFTQDDYGLYPAYAFEVEHTTKVKSGLDRLLKIPSRFLVHLFIIGPGDDERRLFERLIGQTPFRDFRDRLLFRPYDQLESLYNAVCKHDVERKEFGVSERFR